MARRTKRTHGRYNVTARIEQPDGTRRRIYFYGRTQAEAHAKAEQAQARVAAGGPVRDATAPSTAWRALQYSTTTASQGVRARQLSCGRRSPQAVRCHF